MSKGAALEILLKLRDEFSDQIKHAGGALEGFKNKAGAGLSKVRDVAKVAAFALGGVAIAAGAVALSGVNAASDLNESMSKVDVVFGENAKSIQDWAKGAARNLGQTRQEALEAAGTFGNLFDALGLAPDATTKMSKGVVELATDLASFNNIAGSDAIEKLRAGLVGEAEPLRTLGVNITAATTEAKAMELGFQKVNGTFTESEKVQARYALILEQTSNAQGDFARTSGGLANQKRILSAQVKDLQANLGTLLLPVVLLLVSAMGRYLVPALQDVVTWMGTFSEMVKAVLSGDLANAAKLFSELPGPLQQVALWLGKNKDAIQEFISAAADISKSIALDTFEGWKTILIALAPKLQEFGQFLVDHRPLLIALGVSIAVVLGLLVGWPALIAGVVIAAGVLTTRLQEWRKSNDDLDQSLTGIGITLGLIITILSATAVAVEKVTSFIHEHEWAQVSLLNVLKQVAAPMFLVVDLFRAIGPAVTASTAAFEAAIGPMEWVRDRAYWVRDAFWQMRDAIGDAIEKLKFWNNLPGVGAAKKLFDNLPGRADGGMASGWTIVGERGPEIAWMPGGTRIYSNEQSRQMVTAAGAGSSGGGSQQAPVYNITIHTWEQHGSVEAGIAAMSGMVP